MDKLSYTKTTWVNNSTPLSPDNLNHIEGGISNNTDGINDLIDLIGSDSDKSIQSQINAINTHIGGDSEESIQSQITNLKDETDKFENGNRIVDTAKNYASSGTIKDKFNALDIEDTRLNNTKIDGSSVKQTYDKTTGKLTTSFNCGDTTYTLISDLPTEFIIDMDKDPYYDQNTGIYYIYLQNGSSLQVDFNKVINTHLYLNTATISFVYNESTHGLQAVINDGSITTAKLSDEIRNRINYVYTIENQFETAQSYRKNEFENSQKNNEYTFNVSQADRQAAFNAAEEARQKTFETNEGSSDDEPSETGSRWAIFNNTLNNMKTTTLLNIVISDEIDNEGCIEIMYEDDVTSFTDGDGKTEDMDVTATDGCLYLEY